MIRIHYNNSINNRKEVTKRFAEFTKKTIVYKDPNSLVGDIVFKPKGIIEGPMTYEQVMKIEYARKIIYEATRDALINN